MATDMARVIQDGFAGWSHGDLDQAMQGLDPEIEFITSGTFPGLDDVYRGHGGYAKFFGDFRGAWEEISIEIDQLLDCPPSMYLMAGRFRATARDGLVVERPVTIVITTGAGKIKRMESFASREEAYAAAGISS
jgi:ketosteroid isomerase-like protein